MGGIGKAGTFQNYKETSRQLVVNRLVDRHIGLADNTANISDTEIVNKSLISYNTIDVQ